MGEAERPVKGSAEAEAFARLMRELKERAGVSYGLLARRLHTSTSTLHRYCNGEAVPAEFAVVDRFARACGATGEEAVALHRAWLLADARRRSPVVAAPAVTVAATGEDAEAAPVAVATGRGTRARPGEVPDDPAPGTASRELPDTVPATEAEAEPGTGPEGEPAEEAGPEPDRAAEPVTPEAAREAARGAVPGGDPDAVPDVVPRVVPDAAPDAAPGAVAVPVPVPVPTSEPVSGSASAPAQDPPPAPEAVPVPAPGAGRWGRQRRRMVVAAAGATAVVIVAGVLAAAGPEGPSAQAGPAGSTSGVSPTPSRPPAAGASPAPSASVSDPSTASPTPPASAPASPPAPSPSTASAPAAAPLRAAVRSHVWAAGCEHAYLSERAPAEVPPPPLEPDAAAWAQAQRAVHAGSQTVEVTLHGAGEGAVVLQDLQVRVTARRTPPAWNVYQMSQGCGGALTPAGFAVNLDAPRPLARPVTGNDAGDRIPAPVFPMQVSAARPVVLRVVAAATGCDCDWYLELRWSGPTGSGTLRLDDDGRPWRTSATVGRPEYGFASEQGRWTR
ncbi:helix-turn-helix domain-containing protein [Streptomyces sp. NPDC057939]|uniref:helix-turn-helix domain-containing protein n=1 Tax=Streptomyces sp. NPDC057939 TaxID=3346284 RepID=UPI0036E738EE